MFTEFEFPKETAEPLGLKPAKLRNLGQIVALVGPNGAGKSRYLQLVEKIINNCRSLKEEAEKLQRILNPPSRVIAGISGHLERELEKVLASIPKGLKSNAPNPRAVKLTYEMRDYGRDPLTVPPSDVDRVVEANRTGGSPGLSTRQRTQRAGSSQ